MNKILKKIILIGVTAISLMTLCGCYVGVVHEPGAVYVPRPVYAEPVYVPPPVYVVPAPAYPPPVYVVPGPIYYPGPGYHGGHYYRH